MFCELQDPSVLSEYGIEDALLSIQEDEDLEEPDNLDDSDVIWLVSSSYSLSYTLSALLDHQCKARA